MKLTVDKGRLVEEINHLAQFSSCEGPAVTRILYSKEDIESRKWLRTLMTDCGLIIREDGLGNMFGLWQGSNPSLKPIASGSHTDAIPFSGRYDGVVGVLGAIEAIRTLQSSGYVPQRSIEVIQFTAEEPTLFGIGCLGSRALVGNLNLSELEQLRSTEEETIEELRKSASYHSSLNDVLLADGHYEAFVELHIEQGPRLEASQKEIGIVTAIAAPATIQMTIGGEGGHAGAVLMPSRKDALVCASGIIKAVQQIALDSESSDAVATVGKLHVFPGAVNSIPSEITFSIDVRDIRLDTRDKMIDDILDFAKTHCDESGCKMAYEILNKDDPIIASEHIVQTVQSACEDNQLSFMKMPSRAYHDCLFMAHHCPSSMIFIPSFKGFSHRPEEYSTPEEIENGVLVLAEVLKSLSAK